MGVRLDRLSRAMSKAPSEEPTVYSDIAVLVNVARVVAEGLVMCCSLTLIERE